MDVGRIDRDGLAGELWRIKRQFLDQPFKHSMQSARSDILRPRVNLRRDVGQRLLLLQTDLAWADWALSS